MTDEEMKNAFANTQAGDLKAFEPIATQISPALHRFVKAIVKNDELSDDIVQDTLVRAIEKAHTFRGEAAVKTWIFTIARNFAYGHLRKQKLHEKNLSNLQLAVSAGWGQHTDPERIASLKEESRILHEALKALDTEHREIILLRDIEAYSGKQTAEILGLSLAAMKTRLHRARLKLLAELKGRL